MIIADCIKYCKILAAKKKLKAFFLIILLWFNVLIGLFIFSYWREAGMGLKIPFKIRYAIKEQIRLIQNLPYILNKFKSSNLSTYNLLIDDDELVELNNNLPTAATELLGDGNKKYQSAKLIFDGKEYDIKIKYRGSADVHWQYPKKSLRIKFDKKNFFNGFRELNLIIPEDRAFIVEALNHHRAKKLNLISPYEGFVNLTINGKNFGVYLVYEQWDKEFLERNSLPPESNLYGDDYGKFGTVGNIYDANYFWKKYNRDAINKIDNFSEIDKLLDLIKNSPDEEFYKKIFNLIDEDSFYNWQAHSVLAGSMHQGNGGNIRLYFNNAIGKFQFLPWDVFIDVNTSDIDGDPAGDGFIGNAIGYNILTERILKNPEFMLKRNRILWDYVKDDTNLIDDLKYYDEAYKQIKVAVYKDSMKIHSNKFFDNEIERYRNLIIENFNNARTYLNKLEFLVDTRINSAQNQNKIPIIADIFSKSGAPFELSFEIKNIEPLLKENFLIHYDSNSDGIFQREDEYVGALLYNSVIQGYNSPAKLNILLQTRMMLEDKSALEKRLIATETAHRFFLAPSVDKNFKIESIEMNFEVTNYITKEKIAPKAIIYLDDNIFYYFDKINRSAEQFIAENPIFRKKSNDEIILYGGNYTIDRDIIIPKGLKVNIQTGVVMRFKKNVSLVSYSPIIARGERNSPIKILSANFDERRGTFAVVGAQHNRSEFKYVVFERGGEAYINGVFFSGALALHQSDATIENCDFRYTQSDDGLNVKYADIIVKNSLFEKNNSDALDFDYTTGEIADNKFLDNGGDGVDISGSRLEIKNNIITNSGDKGISVGERAAPKIIGNTISGCAVGIASKDGSIVELLNNKIIKNKIGLAAYIKKPLYVVGGQIISQNTIFLDNEKNIETDLISKIELR